MHIIIRPTADEVAIAAADILIDHVRRGATLGLATGSTPVATYKQLIRRHRAGEISFADSRAFLLDEYIGLPPEHEQSYHHTIRHEFTDHIDIDEAGVASPDGMAADPYAAAAAYEQAIIDAGGIDVQLLGVGTNGHIGFNEPGTALTMPTHVDTLHPQTISDNARFFDSAADVPIHVLTQGLGTIQRAGHLVLLATGEHKAEAVASLAEGPLTAMCPASVLQLHANATVIIDEDAAGGLRNLEYYRFVEANLLKR
ncbi:glucosamine-6-phosphate deaminase [Corynebacterium comes]|uniref:Glucosamine-6-phosphate deaminase n=1 Tax=Corynebacterium comes TaxID=2675218 RepID=A0A6B8VR40_9CORY|nr:glucosamine-6-phosphate deaminase [Corynebacterium comes]QGU05529.1 Glucosamine-6-phosphate deaminase [Corynebacterium comes]